MDVFRTNSMTLDKSENKKWEATSDDEWKLKLTIEFAGKDVLCRLHGGENHVGAVALAQWTGDGPKVDVLGVDLHKEDRIAGSIAMTIYRVSRRPTVAVVGIHFDGISNADVQFICDSAMDLARQAAAQFIARLRD